MYLIWENLATCNLFESFTSEGWVIVDVRDLRDGAGNEREMIKRKIILVADLLSIGEKVVIR